MLVFMPAYKHYTAMSGQIQHNASRIIRDVLDTLPDKQIETFIEDEFAVEFFNDRKLLTCTRQSEVSTLESTQVFGEYTSRVSTLYPYAESVAQEYKKAKMPDLVLSYKDKDLYMSLLRKYYLERCREYIKYFLSDKAKYCISFVFRGKGNQYLLPKPSENDGILYINVDIETGNTNCFYSGMWVDIDVARTIVGGLYDLYKNTNKQQVPN